MKKNTFTLFSVCLIFIGIISCQRNDKNTFTLNANTTVIFSFRNLSDSLELSVYNLPIIKTSSFDETTFITSDTSKKQFKIPCEVPSAIYFRIGESPFTGFVRPNDTLSIQIYLTKSNKIDTILFEGKTKPFCDYFLKKKQHLNYQDLRLPLNGAVRNAKAIKENTDTLMNNELMFLANYLSKNNLPEWFVDLEQNQIIYLCNGYKAEQKIFFERRLNLPFNPDKEYYESIDTLIINNSKALLSDWYFYFIKGFLIYNNLDASKINADIWMDSITNKALFEANKKLSGEVRDIFDYDLLNTYLNWTKDLNNYDELFKKYKNDFSNQYYIGDLIKQRNLLTDSIIKNRNDGLQQISSNGLKVNDSIPYFYLPDVNKIFYSPKQFAGKIIYLNFWGTWCKTCLTSIPEKNKLIQEYSNDSNIVFINICVSSEKENWKKILAEKGIKGINLFANDNWSKILIQRFGIREYPTYFLINKGKIIKPYCDYPDKISDDINAILSEK